MIDRNRRVVFLIRFIPFFPTHSPILLFPPSPGAYTAAFVLAFIVGGLSFVLFCLLAAFSHRAFVRPPPADGA